MDVEDSQTEEQALAIDIGARLCEARDNLGLDSEKIAKELNLAVSVITKIEQNIFQQEIPVAFIRGYVKAYATKVGLDTPKILAEFDAQTSQDAPSLSRVQVISKFDSGRRELHSGSFVVKVVSVIVILLFLSYGGYEAWQRLASEDASNEIDLALEDSTQSNEIELQPLNNTAQSEQDNDGLEKVGLIDENTDAATNSQDKNENESDSAVQSADNPIPLTLEQQKVSSSPISSEKISNDTDTETTGIDESLNQPFEMTSLVLDFSADCWVRIVDARGEVIALGVKKSGKHMPIEGVKPINVVLGDPSVVTLQYQNQNYDLSGYRAGKRAEIILN